MELKLPVNFVELEMSQEVFGKGYWTQVGNAEWTYTFTRADCQNLSMLLGAGSSLSGALAKFVPAVAPYAAGISAVLGAASYAFKTGTRYGGVRVYFHNTWFGRLPRWAQYI